MGIEYVALKDFSPVTEILGAFWPAGRATEHEHTRLFSDVRVEPVRSPRAIGKAVGVVFSSRMS